MGLVAQSCLTLCDPMDCSPPGSSVHRIPQARVLEWVAISFSRPDPRITPGSPALQEDSLLSEPPGKPSELEDTLKILSRKPLIFPWKTLKIRGEVTYPNQLGPPPWGFSSRLLSYFLQQFCGPVDYNTAHGQKILPHQQNSFPG